MVSHYSTTLQVAVVCQEMQQYTNKGREEEDYELVNMGVNNAVPKKKKISFANVFWRKICRCFFGRLQGYTQSALV